MEQYLDLEVKHPTLSFTQEDVEEILKLHGKTKKDLALHVEIILKWIASQPHLSAPYPSNRFIMNYIIRNKFYIEKTKEKIDLYYTSRSVLPELFKNRLPNGDNLMNVSRFMRVIFLPELVDYSRVHIFYVGESNVNFDGDSFVARLLLFVELLSLYDFSNKLTLVLDFEKISLHDLKPFTLTTIKKVVSIITNIFSNRMDAIHFVKVPNYMVTIMNLFITLLPQKVKERVKVHKDSADLFKYIPKKVLPQELGGDGHNYKYYSDQTEDMLLQNVEHFKIFNNIRVDESLRPQKLDNDEILGYHGNFKRLQVD